jgi:hypothetical protein
MNVCDHCAAHSRMLRRCGRCSHVFYCNALCQRSAWTAQHRHACRRLRELPVAEPWTPIPFRTARLRLDEPGLVSYARYLELIELFATPGDWERARAEQHLCPPAVAAALAGEPRADDIINRVRVLFLAMTGLHLNVYTPFAWEDAHAVLEEHCWFRDPADNERTVLQSLTYTACTTRAGDARGTREIVALRDSNDASLANIIFNACRCCSVFATLMVMFEGDECMKHTSVDVRNAEVQALDLMSRSSGLDIFTAAALLPHAPPSAALDADGNIEATPCLCRRSVSSADVTSKLGSTIELACVRITLECGVIDCIAVVMRPVHVPKPACAATLRVTGDIFEAATTLA